MLTGLQMELCASLHPCQQESGVIMGSCSGAFVTVVTIKPADRTIVQQIKELIARERAGSVCVGRVGVCVRSSQREAVFRLHSAKVCLASGSQDPTETNTCHIIQNTKS